MHESDLDVERVRLLAERDQLRAEGADLRRKARARELIEGLRAVGVEHGRCPVCRCTVPADPPAGATG